MGLMEWLLFLAGVSADGILFNQQTDLYAAMPVFYDCDKMACNIKEWDDTAGGDGVQADLSSFLREEWTTALLSLHQYPFVSPN
jgi:hypothetical protein